MICNQLDFEKEHLKDKAWYWEAYPFLSKFEFPIAYKDLQDFYLFDMNFRNLTPVENYVNCYEAVFSYFLENFPRLSDGTRFRGKTFLQRFPQNLYDAVGRTIKPAVDIIEGAFNMFELVGSITKNLWFVVYPLGGYFIYKYFLKGKIKL